MSGLPPAFIYGATLVDSDAMHTCESAMMRLFGGARRCKQSARCCGGHRRKAVYSRGRYYSPSCSTGLSLEHAPRSHQRRGIRLRHTRPRKPAAATTTLTAVPTAP